MANALALTGAVAIVASVVALSVAVRGGGVSWWLAASLILVVASWTLAVRLYRPPRSRATVSGHIVLFETPIAAPTAGHTPPLTIRGPRDAVERFIPQHEFGALFGGWALWRAPDVPTPEMPGEALGVWSRRTCKRFRRILRERGATLEVRRVPGPEQRLARLVTQPRYRR